MILSHVTDFVVNFCNGSGSTLLIARIGVVKCYKGVKALDGKLRTAVCERYV